MSARLLALGLFSFFSMAIFAGAQAPAPMEKTQKEMMGKMDKHEMHAMMQDCMSMHKDGKMCNSEVMGKCKEMMGQGDCQKMMKNMEMASPEKK